MNTADFFEQVRRRVRGNGWTIGRYIVPIAALVLVFIVATHVHQRSRSSEEYLGKVVTDFHTFGDPTSPSGEICFQNYLAKRLTLQKITVMNKMDWLAPIILSPNGSQAEGVRSNMIVFNRTVAANSEHADVSATCLPFYLGRTAHQKADVESMIEVDFTSPDDDDFSITRLVANKMKS